MNLSLNTIKGLLEACETIIYAITIYLSFLWFLGVGLSATYVLTKSPIDITNSMLIGNLVAYTTLFIPMLVLMIFCLNFSIKKIDKQLNLRRDLK